MEKLFSPKKMRMRRFRKQTIKKDSLLSDELSGVVDVMSGRSVECDMTSLENIPRPTSAFPKQSNVTLRRFSCLVLPPQLLPLPSGKWKVYAKSMTGTEIKKMRETVNFVSIPWKHFNVCVLFCFFARKPLLLEKTIKEAIRRAFFFFFHYWAALRWPSADKSEPDTQKLSSPFDPVPGTTRFIQVHNGKLICSIVQF